MKKNWEYIYIYIYIYISERVRERERERERERVCVCVCVRMPIKKMSPLYNFVFTLAFFQVYNMLGIRWGEEASWRNTFIQIFANDMFIPMAFMSEAPILRFQILSLLTWRLFLNKNQAWNPNCVLAWLLAMVILCLQTHHRHKSNTWAKRFAAGKFFL